VSDGASLHYNAAVVFAARGDASRD
jgi:hypothetical protein